MEHCFIYLLKETLLIIFVNLGTGGLTFCFIKTCHTERRLTEIDEESSVALSLVVRHGHDAADVVLLGTVLLLRKVSDQVTALRIVL